MTASKSGIYLLVIASIFLASHLLIFAQNGNVYTYTDSLLAISKDGNVTAVSGRSITDTSSSTGQYFPIDLYDNTSGELIVSYDGSEFSVTALTLSATGNLLSYANNGGLLEIVDPVSRSVLRTISQSFGVNASDPQWNSNDTFITVRSGRVLVIYDATTLTNIATIVDDHNPANLVIGYDWHPNNTTIAVAMRDSNTSATQIQIWNVLGTNSVVLEQTLETTVASQISWNPEGQLIATNQRGGIKVIDITTASEAFYPSPDASDAIRSVAWSPDNTAIAGGGNEAVHVWDTQSSLINRTIQTSSPVRDVFWSPDGQYLYHSGGEDGIYRDGVALQTATAQE
jgi:WD40 repeat protein